MNILPHKSWHVRTKKNIERVRRDEEKAAEEEKEKLRRIALAEQEARTSLLRLRTKQQEDVISDRESDLPSQALTSGAPAVTDLDIPVLRGKQEHLNFFKDIEDGLEKQGKNKEHEAEKKKEQEELEKKIGLLTYLGQTALDEKESAPWYLKKKSHKKKKANDKSRHVDSSDEDNKDVKINMAMEQKRREFMDPLIQMKQYVDKKKGKQKKHKNKEKDRKPDRKRREVKSSSLSIAQTCSSSSKKTIKELRAERLARERREKLKAQQLVSGTSQGGGGEDADTCSSREERQGGKRMYNSQYNPEFVRQAKARRRDEV